MSVSGGRCSNIRESMIRIIKLTKGVSTNKKMGREYKKYSRSGKRLEKAAAETDRHPDGGRSTVISPEEVIVQLNPEVIVGGRTAYV